MINVIHPFCKLEYIIKSYHENPHKLCEDFGVQENGLLDLIKGCFELEFQKEEYKCDLLNKSEICKIFEFETTNILKSLDAFEMDKSDFINIRLEINPYARFINSSHIFAICDGTKLHAAEHTVQCLLVPKIVATNELRIEEHFIIGPLKFLVSVNNSKTSFSVSQLIRSMDEQRIDLLIKRIKKMMLMQLLIIV